MLTATFILITAAVLLGAFVTFRIVEHKRGVRLFEVSRAALDVHALILWNDLVTGGVPLKWRHSAKVIAHQATHGGLQSLVILLRAAERPLARLSYKLRVSAPKAGGREVSQYLKTITPE
ncbi:MAG: hypothetical protein AAB955_00985 [Patescibacteria group bacterium]